MDPLSIAASALAIFGAAEKIVKVLVFFTTDVREADTHVEDLQNEASGLAQAAMTMHKTWLANKTLAHTCSRDDPDLWNNVHQSLQSCMSTLDRLATKLSSLDKGNAGPLERSISILKRTSKAIQLSLSHKEISRFRRQIHSHYLAMQIGLSSFQISLQLENNESTFQIDRRLKTLNGHLQEIQSISDATEKDEGLSPLEKKETGKPELNHRELARAAKSFWSSTTTAISGERSTVYGGSVIGDHPLSSEKRTAINDWVQGNDDDLALQQMLALNEEPSEILLLITMESIQELLQTAVKNFNSGDFSGAGESLRAILEYNDHKDHLQTDWSAVTIMLAYVYALQEKWDLVESIITSSRGFESQDETLKLDLLALFYRQKEDYDKATKFCTEAIKAKSSRFGQRSLPVYHSISLAANLCESRGRSVEAKNWLRFITNKTSDVEDALNLYNDILSTSLDAIIKLVGRLSQAQEDLSAIIVEKKKAEHSNARHHQPPPPPPIRTVITPVVPSGPSKYCDLPIPVHSEMSDLPEVVQSSPVMSRMDSKRESYSTYSPMSPMSGFSDFHSHSQFAPLGQQQQRPPQSPISIAPTSTVGKWTLRGHGNWVRSVSFSPDSKYLVSASEDSTVKIWELRTGAVQCTLKGHKGFVSSAVFSPDGQYVASGSRDDTIKIWDLATKAERCTLSGHKNSVTCVVYSPDGGLIASGSEDKTIRLWDVAMGSTWGLLEPKSSVTSIAFSPDGSQLASASGNSIRLWDITTKAVRLKIKGHKGNILSIAFSPDGALLVSGSEDGTVRMWDVLTGAEMYKRKDLWARVRSVAYSPDNRFFVSTSEDRSIHVRDAKSGQILGKFQGHAENAFILSVAYSPDGRIIATGADDNIIKFWDPEGKRRGSSIS